VRSEEWVDGRWKIEDGKLRIENGRWRMIGLSAEC
jgi:hypothetical protein